MRRGTALLCAAVLALLLAPRAGAASTPAIKAPVVAVIDTGVRASHMEFDYRGRTSTTDQFVAWWDFTSEVKKKVVNPSAGQLWDTAVPNPYDRHGHGTLTASMVGGRNAFSGKTPSAAPGVKLAIAKVGTKDGTIEGDLGAAIRWAATTVHADVINISIGTQVPVPAALFRDELDAIEQARARGVLVVVANGNGYANAGIPGDPGWANSPSGSPYVLAVGASGSDGYFVTTDPEVSAAFTVTGASYTSDREYVKESGTSFGSPYVAGFAAALVRAGREGRHPLSADRLELLLKSASSDTSVPPPFEGYGVLSHSQLPSALRHARAGTLPTRPSPDRSALYVESVAGTMRTAWSAF